LKITKATNGSTVVRNTFCEEPSSLKRLCILAEQQTAWAASCVSTRFKKTQLLQVKNSALQAMAS